MPVDTIPSESFNYPKTQGKPREATPNEQAEEQEALLQNRIRIPPEESRRRAPWWVSALTCYRPLRAFRSDSGQVVLGGSAQKLNEDDLALPCGRCIGCREMRSKEWAVRCTHEIQMHTESSFVTLTYNDSELPDDYSVSKDELLSFVKKLRQAYARLDGRKLRYFGCGEYGSLGRPHYHLLLFGTDFSHDRYVDRVENGNHLARSPLLETTWGKGHVHIGEANFKTAAYIARYTLKKVGSSDDDYICHHPVTGEVLRQAPEFLSMSRRPGIGHSWFHKYASDLYPNDHVNVKGRKHAIPRYYSKLLDDLVENYRLDPAVREQRDARRNAFMDDQAEHFTPDRLIVREEVKQAKLNRLKRT